jgi:hypothetical protein
MDYQWERCIDYNEMKELFETVIFDEDCWDKKNMLTKHKDLFRGYIAKYNNKVIACGTIAWLKNSEVLHIDCFALSNDIRGMGMSYSLFNSFLIFVKNEWSIIKNIDKLLIEVYLPNVEVWNKIMGVVDLKIDNKVTKNRVKNSVIIMGKNIDEPIKTYNEWQNIEMNW